ncbi:MAG: hypothetical protein LBM38_04035 [Clostridiales bacterium]|jgi:hypothetical protein|nr:hypothetical protein [Clostridiales bacterium]
MVIIKEDAPKPSKISLKFRHFFTHIKPESVFLLLAILVIIPIFIIPIAQPSNGALFASFKSMGMYATENPLKYGWLGRAAVLPIPYTVLGYITFFIHKVIPAGSVLDSRVLGAIYCILLLICVFNTCKGFNTIKHRWTNYLFALLCVLILCDYSNLAFFNTLFSLPILFVSLMAIIAIFISVIKGGSIRYWQMALLLIIGVSLAFLGDKLSAWLAVVIGVLAYAFLARHTRTPDKSFILGFFIILIIASGGYNAFFVQGASYKQDLYNSVFFGITDVTSVESIALPDSFNGYAEHFYSSDNPIDNGFYKVANYKSIITYYLRNPSDLFSEIKYSVQNAFGMRGLDISGEAPGNFRLYALLKSIFAPATRSMMVLFLLIYFGVSIYVSSDRTRKDSTRQFAGLLACLSVIEFLALVAPIVLTGRFLVNYNTSLAGIIFDILVLFGIVGGIRILLENNDRNKEKFGIEE